jgi:hypothetical protein
MQKLQKVQKGSQALLSALSAADSAIVGTGDPGRVPAARFPSRFASAAGRR